MAIEDFIAGAGGLLTAIGGGAALTGAYDRLGDIGDAAREGANVVAQQGLEQTQFQPFTVRSSTGGQFTGTGSDVSMSLSPQEMAIQNQLMGQAQGQLGSDPYGLSQTETAAGSAFGLGEQFMGMAGQGTAAREQDVYNRMRALQSPEEERQRLGLEERLASQGRLGVSTNMFGGTPEQLALAKAQEEAKNQASLMALQQGQAEQLQQANIGQAYAGLGTNLAGQGLGLQSAQQQLGLGSLMGAYAPQNQLLNVQQASQLYPQLGQRGQLQGANLFGEASMGGLEAQLGAALGQANLMGDLGSGLLGGASSGLGSFFGGLGDWVFGDSGNSGSTP